MGYIGQAPANKAITSADIEDGVVSAADLGANSVDSSELVDGSIDTSHLGALQVTGAKLNTDVISAQTALGAAPADTDELLVSDAGVLKRVDYSYLKGITAANFRPNAKPIIINGNMQVSQRGDTTGKTNANSGYYACDRYKFNEDGTMTAVLSISQETLTSGNAFADGHTRALKYDVTTADASVASDIYARIEQRFEKQDLQVFKKGTSSAETFTLAFWVKATVTGTNVVELQDQVNTRHCCGTYAISSSNTWEHKVINFAADTSTGDPFGTGNGLAMNINFVLQAGSNYTSGTLATAWADSTDANRAAGHDSNHFSSTSNNFHITGVQLEVGTYTSSTIPPFQHESYGDNLMRCRRYTQLHMDTDEDGGPFLGQCFAYTTSNWQSSLQLVPPMRTGPTVSSISGSNKYRIYSNGGTVEYDQIDLNSATDVGGTMCTVVDLSLDSASGGTAGYAGKTKGNSTGAGKMLVLEAEL